MANDSWNIYQSRDGWRWTCTASNGRIVGASSEAYTTRANCVMNAKRFGYTGN